MAAAASGRKTNNNHGTNRSVSAEAVKMAEEDEKILRDMVRAFNIALPSQISNQCSAHLMASPLKN